MLPDRQFTQTALSTAKAIQALIMKTAPLPSEPAAPADQPVVPHSLFTTAGGFLQKVAFQVNACYLATAYDGCAVMMRKLVESLIIDCFERHNIADKIKHKGTDDYVMLRDLVKAFLAETAWQGVGRNVKSGLDKLKDLKGTGDLSAHTRFYTARREYIDELKTDLRVVVERLLYLSGHKK
jgi:hypothetical protein